MPIQKIPTSITDDMIAFANHCKRKFLGALLQALKDGVPGTDINAPNIRGRVKRTQGYTALHQAASLSSASLPDEKASKLIAEIIQALLDRGADINAQETTDGNTPLHLAVQYGNEAAVNALLKDSAIDVNVKNNSFATPLDITSRSTIYRLLVANRAEHNL